LFSTLCLTLFDCVTLRLSDPDSESLHLASSR
jgi:hypothetical protein